MRCSVDRVHCAMCIVHRTVFIVHRTVYSVRMMERLLNSGVVLDCWTRPVVEGRVGQFGRNVW